uniref:GIY-YIG domain-containing protein n=1 Tax=Lotharella globosa TaxID=91324 RepID=A0A7S3YL94_9EUKA
MMMMMVWWCMLGATTTGVSVVYVVCTRAGGLYVGQTDEIHRRIKEHRRTYGGDLVLCYAVLEDGGATRARDIEGQLMTSFRGRDLALLNSDRDMGTRIRPRI